MRRAAGRARALSRPAAASATAISQMKAPAHLLRGSFLLLGALKLCFCESGDASGVAPPSRRTQDLARSSGLLLGGAEERMRVKYQPGNSLPPFPNSSAGTFFSGVFANHAVLQRGPARAAVFGVLFGAKTDTTVELTLRSRTPHGNHSHQKVDAVVTLTGQTTPSGQYAKWKALLSPVSAGGNYTLSVSCKNCQNSTASTLVDITFGDVVRP